MKAIHWAKSFLLEPDRIQDHDRAMLTIVVSAEAPQLTLSDGNIPMDTTETTNGHFKEHVSDGQRNSPLKIASGRAGMCERL